MKALIVVLIVLAVLWLISLIRLGGRLRYGADGIFITVFVGPYRLQPFPASEKKGPEEQGGLFVTLAVGPWRMRLVPAAKKKPKKPKKEKPLKEKKPKKPRPEGQPGTLTRLLGLLPTVGEALGALRRRIRFDDVGLTLVWGGSDPASIAIGYGQANAALGVVWPLVENNFKVKRRQFRIDMEYGRTEPAVEAAAAFTITVGQILYLAVRYGMQALIQWIRSGRPAA